MRSSIRKTTTVSFFSTRLPFSILIDTDYDFTAHQVYACLVTVPFFKDPATQLLNYIADTLTYQSTISYLRDPPSSYQQPAIGVVETLSFLQDLVDTSSFSNQYEFEAAVQRLLLRMHDAHVVLSGGLLEYVVFGAPMDLLSLSSDGMALPRIHTFGVSKL